MAAPNLVVDPEAQFELSPYLYMQFMEPLGVANGGMDAVWDYQRDDWRDDLVRLTRELAPSLMRWPGGCLSSYYRWREGVGPWRGRPPLLNQCWGGLESNRIGTHEFVAFCRSVGADPLVAVNFESDGRRPWMRDPVGGDRCAGAGEAADWVAYCNAPDHPERAENGSPEPLGVELWQIGNETSYDAKGFGCETAARKTLEFAEAMRGSDPDIRLIGWGDDGWAPKMLEVAGGELDFLAFHHHFGSGRQDSVLHDNAWRADPARTWDELMGAWRSTDGKIAAVREQVSGHDVKLAMTKSHFGLRGRNRCEVQSTWASGVANARVLNTHERHGDVLKIATLGDFCGTKWQNNVLMLPSAHGAYMMPLARVTALFGRHRGERALKVVQCPHALDVTASRTGARVFLHAVNTSRTDSVEIRLAVEGMRIESATAWQIAADPMAEAMETRPDTFKPREPPLPAGETWQIPPASVSAVEALARRE